MGDAPVYVKVEQVTPEKAARLLSLNTHNRDLNPSRVKTLAGAISRGEWKINGDCLVFSGNGSGGILLNGQHRLHAVVQAQHPITVAVMHNAPFEAQETMDSGQGRTMGAKLKLRGEKYYNDLGSALSLAYTYDKHGEPRYTGSAWTHQQLFQYLSDNPGIRDTAALSLKIRTEFGSAAGSWQAWIYLTNRAIGQDKSDFFYDQLVNGLGLAENDPVYLLRRLLLKQRGLPSDRRLGARTIAACLVKSINAFALGQEMSLLKFDVREEFPKLVTKKDLL